MVKRGEVKSSAARHHAAHKPAARRQASSAIVADSAREIRVSSDVLQKEEKAIVKEVRFILSPEEFHVVTFVASLIILGFLFSSKGMIFFSVLAAAALLFAHFMSRHHRPHDVLAILWIFFLPVMVTIALFRDVMVWLLLGLFTWSAVSTFIIYHHHRKKHAPLKVMWQVTYSKIVAVTLALIVASLLPMALPDSFLSVFELIFFYVLPVAFVFFFASKFFYLYFFDRVHIRHDLQKSARHTIIYSLAFIVALMCIYSLLAVLFFNSQMEGYNKELDNDLLRLGNVEKSVARLPPAVAGLEVSKDLAGFIALAGQEISDKKAAAADASISLSSIVDDSYVDSIVSLNADMIRSMYLVDGSADVRRMISDEEERLARISEGNGTFPDRSISLDAYASGLKAQVEEEFVVYSADPSVQELLAQVDNPDVSYGYFEQGIFYWLAKDAGLTSVYDSGSMFGRQLSIVVLHSIILRDMARSMVKINIMVNNEAVSSAVMEHLYANRDSDRTQMSSAVRYTILKRTIDTREANLRTAERLLSLRVE